jgi:hypothetical protein
MVKFNPGWGWDYKFGLISLLIKKGYTMSPGSPCQEDDGVLWRIHCKGTWRMAI